MGILEALSFAIHWPTVGWIGVGIVSAVTVAVVASIGVCPLVCAFIHASIPKIRRG